MLDFFQQVLLIQQIPLLPSITKEILEEKDLNSEKIIMKDIKREKKVNKVRNLKRKKSLRMKVLLNHELFR